MAERFLNIQTNIKKVSPFSYTFLIGTIPVFARVSMHAFGASLTMRPVRSEDDIGAGPGQVLVKEFPDANCFQMKHQNKIYTKPHRFYICQQPHLEPGELFVMHTRKPLSLFRVRRSEKNVSMELVKCWEETDPEKLEAVRKWATDWYYYSFVREKAVL